MTMIAYSTHCVEYFLSVLLDTAAAIAAVVVVVVDIADHLFVRFRANHCYRNEFFNLFKENVGKSSRNMFICTAGCWTNTITVMNENVDAVVHQQKSY